MAIRPNSKPETLSLFSSIVSDLCNDNDQTWFFNALLFQKLPLDLADANA